MSRSVRASTGPLCQFLLLFSSEESQDRVMNGGKERDMTCSIRFMETARCRFSGLGGGLVLAAKSRHDAILEGSDDCCASASTLCILSAEMQSSFSSMAALVYFPFNALHRCFFHHLLYNLWSDWSGSEQVCEMSLIYKSLCLLYS